MQLILKYFPNLTEKQVAQYAMLQPLYEEWNAKINVVSRKDIDQLMLHHVLHSLAISKYVRFADGAEILDVGTGGGFPGIPLAIMFPECQFLLIDGTLKKIKVVQAVAEALKLENVQAQQVRAEEVKGRKFDFVTSRAVTTIDLLFGWSNRLLKTRHLHAIPNGLLTLKGGNLKEELKLLPRGSYYDKTPVTTWFKESYFEEKYVLYVQG